MTKSVYARARLEPDVKERAETIFKKLGLTASEAINLYYQQVAYNNGIPFDLRVPTAETKEALDNAFKGKNLKFRTI